MTRDLIVFGEDWGGLPSSTQHLIRRLQHQRKVVWVNSIGLRRPQLHWRDIKRAFCKLTARRSPNPNQPQPESTPRIVHPRTLPAPRSALERRLARELLQRQLAPVLHQERLHRPILWTSLPTAVDMAGCLGESALVYYCGDDFNALAGVDHDTVSQREQELVQRADLILAASENLAARFPSARTQLLPHGVDYHSFASPAPRAPDLPNDGRPIAGFYGSLSQWIDIELLQQTASALPHWHFVFVGQPVVDISALQRLENVTFLGPRPHGELPSYSQHWQASLLPFRDNAQIRACNPLKLLEYMAAGRPIVSTRFPALSAYPGAVSVVDGVDDMVAALQRAASTTTLDSQQQLASQHDWDRRADQLEQWLESL
ncbi:glycosyl transferase [Bacterioplanes sanyensis]|uniref:Glycosyl transferase n=1 Tax=Bacterioplanes sanyensis TaxID=1249553 RepID=A0A222FLJ6_9GAMM|nr:glycosyltransferase [Bacterioplanes sanyensis]ASP39650.1 glycosyl transferase [Bacterioplanes sanyensis]